MRWFSTPQSAATGEPTVLAIVETLIASAGVIALCIWTDSLWWIISPSIVTPFLLLRTRFSERKTRSVYSCLKTPAIRSTRLSLELSVAAYSKLMQVPLGSTIVPNRQFQLFLYSLGWTSILLQGAVGLSSRVIGTVYAAFKHLFASFGAVPSNWWRYCFCTDFAHPPEMLPGAELANQRFLERIAATKFSYELEKWVKYLRYKPRWPAIIAIAFFLLFVWLPAYFYRFSLKSTSVVLAPLAYSARRFNHGNLALRHRLDDSLHGASERLQRCWAAFTLSVAIAAIFVTAFWPSWVQWFPATDESSTPAVLSAFQYLYLPVWDGVVHIKGWHIARAVNAILLYVVYFYADKASRRLDAGVWTTRQIQHWLDSLFATQWLLSAYLWFCGLIAFWRFMHEPGFLPAIDLQLLP